MYENSRFKSQLCLVEIKHIIVFRSLRFLRSAEAIRDAALLRNRRFKEITNPSITKILRNMINRLAMTIFNALQLLNKHFKNGFISVNIPNLLLPSWWWWCWCNIPKIVNLSAAWLLVNFKIMLLANELIRNNEN